MRTLQQVQGDLKALGRPVFPALALPPVIEKWRFELARWRMDNPEGDVRYEELLREWDAIEAEDMQRRWTAARTRLWGEAHLPKRVAAAVADAEPTDAMKAVLAWRKDSKPWLVLRGRTGVGKSVAAGWALHQAYLDGQRVMWCEAARLPAKAGGFDGQEYAFRLRGADLLVVDDLGMEGNNDFALSVVRGVLQDRHESELRTIITTNLGRAELARHLGPALADRVEQSCMAVELNGASLRGGTP